MNLAELALRNRTVTLVLTVAMLGAGVSSYQGLSRLEDPEFTIKTAQVYTRYPGASAAEVEEEVSDTIELAVQKLSQLDLVESKSDRGLSVVTVDIKDRYTREHLPQVWDELRRKVGDAQGELPPGAGPSVVVDDFGDVYGVFFALYGPEYSYAELEETAKLLRRELLLVQDVAKIDFWGERSEAVYVEPSRERMSQLGVPMHTVIDALRKKNVVADSGRVQVGSEFLAVDPTGTLDEVADFESLLITGAEGRQIYLNDIAGVRRGYVEPADRVLRYDGHPAIGIGISTVSGGNVVTMGAAAEQRARELLDQIPLGIQAGIISLQSSAVETAIQGFLVSLLQAVAIVIVVLLFFMGLRSGLLIGFILLLTIVGTFIFMGPWNVALERISLGALIIALGMLVDNAIVVVDGMLVRIEQGRDPAEAAVEVVAQTSLPLLGATAVAIMAFAAIGTSQDSTGEFCRSLFQVVLISLSLSWLTAVTVTPVLGVMMLKPPGPAAAGGASTEDPYDARLFRAYRGLLVACLRTRALTVGVVVAIFGVSVWGFGYVDQLFFPSSTRPQFMVEFWLPQGTHIDETVRAVEDVEEYLLDLEGVTHVSSFTGGGAMRFLLTYTPEKPNSAYALFLVDVDDYRKIDGLLAGLEPALRARHADAEVYGKKFLLGPGEGGKIQVRITGPDATELRKLASRVMDVMYADGGAKGIRTDWRQKVKVVRPLLAEEEASLAGIDRPDVATVIKVGFEGETVGVYRERDRLLPIVLRAPPEERVDVTNMGNLQIWSSAAGRWIPLRQVISGFETVFEDEIIQRRDRKRTITVHADPTEELPSVLLTRLMPEIGAVELPTGYELEYGGEYEDSRDAQAALAGQIPMFVVAMILIVIMLFNALRQPAVIWLTVPLALIGVTAGLLLTGQPFGFMALLGFLSLSGMLIKNAIVLIDEIELQRRAQPAFAAIVDAGVSRLRPVSMAALTTALGMIPLLQDAFFVAMAVTIIFGLVVATVLTMIFVPVLYAMLFRVSPPGD